MTRYYPDDDGGFNDPDGLRLPWPPRRVLRGDKRIISGVPDLPADPDDDAEEEDDEDDFISGR